MKKNKLVINILLYFIVEFLFITLFYTLFFESKIVSIILFIINIIYTWVLIKSIEKKYYSKYDKFSSMLYNICPLIGVVILYLLDKYIFRSDLSLMFLFFVYIFLGEYILNVIYILSKRLFKKYK